MQAAQVNRFSIARYLTASASYNQRSLRAR
jgi:hypothetical protein